MTANLRRAAALTTIAALALAGCGSTDQDAPDEQTPDTPRATSPIDFNLPAAQSYHRTATYPVYLNKPMAGVPPEDPAAETVAEISTVTPDGNTVIYTDAAGKRIGFLDIRDPAKPVGLGTLSLAELGDADDQPTSVAAFGEFVLVVVDTIGGDFPNPSGRVDVVRVSDRTRVHSIDLGGQPDSIAISPRRVVRRDRHGEPARRGVHSARQGGGRPAAAPNGFRPTHRPRRRAHQLAPRQG